MSYSANPYSEPQGWREAIRHRFAGRAAGLIVTLAVEAVLLLLLLTLGQGIRKSDPPRTSVVSFDVKGDSPSPPEEKPEEVPETPLPKSFTPAEQMPRAPVPPSAIPAAAQPQPAPPAQAIVPIAPRPPSSADNTERRRPDAPSGPAYGPASPGGGNDTPVVGRALGGQPLYAASWYQEPTDGEMRGYLSTATGPGYALIACRTMPRWRVSDCVELEEFPNGSNIARAALAAAWQFQVRPPRRGNRVLVGEWVRIRISLTPAGR